MPTLPAARRTWFALDPDGREHTVVLTIGVPEQQPGGEWGSLVAMAPFDIRERLIFGVDAWQAISLAMELVAMRVQHFADDGWQFFWEKGGDPASPNDLRSERQPQ